MNDLPRMTRSSLSADVRLVVAALACLGTVGCAGPGSAEPDSATLAVLMVVDQLRPDMLERYDPLFTGGLRRLLDDGHRFPNATHDHAFTETAAGHVTLSTGVYPSRHGVVGNSWSERDGDTWHSVYSVEEPGRTILGYPDLPGRGPENIERPGLADWIAANDPASRVVSISRKDRAAIGMAAQAVGDVYWLAERGGEFITSDAYHSEYPDWVVDFNRATMPEVFAQTSWESTVPSSDAHLSRPDTSRFELDGEHTFFPHPAGELVDADDESDLNRWRYEYTPFPDRAVVELAMRAVGELGLGTGSSVDFLGMSLSQTDLVGHYFGPLSREQLDNLLRLDRELGRFFAFLDDTVGEGKWVLGFSSDHGVLDIPEQLAEDGLDAHRLTRAERSLFIRTVVDNYDPATGSTESVEDALLDLPFVEATYPFTDVSTDQPADSFATLFAHSFWPGRVRGIEGQVGLFARLSENLLEWGSAPATHGSPYYYDRHVPLIFLGGNIPSGVSNERVATVDMAPTLARLTGVPFPNDLDGRALLSASSR